MFYDYRRVNYGNYTKTTQIYNPQTVAVTVFNLFGILSRLVSSIHFYYIAAESVTSGYP